MSLSGWNATGWNDVLDYVEIARSPRQWGVAPTVIVMVVVIIATLYTTVRVFTDPESAVDYDVPAPVEVQPGWNPRILSSPSLKTPGSSAIQCYAPATGADLGLVNPATPDGIDRAITRAEEAQKEWAKTSFPQRREVLKTLLKFILDNQDTIARVACLDSGKTRIDASFGEILVTAERIKWTINHGEKALRPQKRPTNLLMLYKHNEVRYEPRGVVAACVSWNYPFHQLIGPIISSIFAGNGIVVKGSEQTAWSSKYFTAVARGALEACGHNPNLVQSIVCWPSVAAHLTSHPRISHLTFIGSRQVAQHVAASASTSLTELCLELGGKDPAIVLSDAQSDLDRVVATLMRGVFQSAGQNCVGIERIICVGAIYPLVAEKMAAIVTQLQPGSALDITGDSRNDQKVDVGALISDTRFAELEALIAEAVAQGAKLLVGGTRYKHPLYPSGHYFQPTLLADVKEDMRIAKEELFAPIGLLMYAPSVEAAVELANSTEYALAFSVFGSNAEDLEYVVSGVKAGMVSVNDYATYYAVQLPFGGVKGSGYGRFAGKEGLRSLCAMKSVCADRWPMFIKTSIPAPLRLPYPSEGAAWDMCAGIVEMGYGESLSRMLGGLMKIIRNSMGGGAPKPARQNKENMAK